MRRNCVAVMSLVVLVAIFAAAKYTQQVVVRTKGVPTPAFDVRNMTYKVENGTFTLKNGKSEIEYTPGSATKNTLMLFGEPAYGDLDGDGDTDAAVLLVNNSGGSGTFYYAALVVNDGTQIYHTTRAMLLGDRIAPQTIEIHEGRAVYNFAERRADEPMSMQPSIGKSVWVYYDKKSNEIGEWVKGFEGESNLPR